MKAYQIGTILTLTLTALIAFQNCGRGAGSGVANTSADDIASRAELDVLETRIKTLAAEDLSCTADADCALVPVGAFHCGLPTFELVSSLRNEQHPRVVSLASEYAQLEAAYIRRQSGSVRSCGAPVYPRPVCRQNTCVIPTAN